MTNEEAIHILRDSKPSTIMKEGKVLDRVASVCIAIDMAIESLKHTTCYLDSPCEYQNPDIKIPKVQGIVWHPYPEEKPSATDAYYLVTTNYGGKLKVMTSWWIDSQYRFGVVEDRVLAWAELPEPYRKENADGTD